MVHIVSFCKRKHLNLFADARRWTATTSVFVCVCIFLLQRDAARMRDDDVRAARMWGVQSITSFSKGPRRKATALATKVQTPKEHPLQLNTHLFSWLNLTCRILSFIVAKVFVFLLLCALALRLTKTAAT
jgi:hypothetical protein